MRPALLVVVTACATPTAAPIHNAANPSPPPPAVKLPSAYAALFVDGARYKLGDATCEIVAARPLPGGWQSSLQCTGTELAKRVDHDFAATTTGLWIVGVEFDGNFAALEPDDMVMAATPKDIMKPTIADPTYPTGHLFELHPEGDAWCMGELGYGGDESAWQICLSARGVTGIWSQIPGGPEASYGVVRKADGS